jgi:hypothetical protein
MHDHAFYYNTNKFLVNIFYLHTMFVTTKIAPIWEENYKQTNLTSPIDDAWTLELEVQP